MANRVNGTFTATGTSAEIKLLDNYSFSLSGTWAGTVELQRYDTENTEWVTISAPTTSGLASFTANIALNGEEVNARTPYRVNCTAFTSGTIKYNLRQGSRIAK
jgi:hypothetical protein